MPSWNTTTLGTPPRPTWLPTRKTDAQGDHVEVATKRLRRHTSSRRRFRHQSQLPRQRLTNGIGPHVGLCQTVDPKCRGRGSADFNKELHRRKMHTLHPRNPRGHCRKSGIIANLPTPRHAAPTSQLHSGTQHGLSVTKDKSRPGSAHHRHRCHTTRNATITPKTSSAAANQPFTCLMFNCGQLACFILIQNFGNLSTWSIGGPSYGGIDAIKAVDRFN